MFFSIFYCFIWKYNSTPITDHTFWTRKRLLSPSIFGIETISARRHSFFRCQFTEYTSPFEGLFSVVSYEGTTV